MIETIAALALCVQVADYAAFHLSYHPDETAASDRLYEQSDAWAQELSRLTPDASSFVIAMHDADQIAYGMDGATLLLHLDRCERNARGSTPPGSKG